jgi:hypothetical protein
MSAAKAARRKKLWKGGEKIVVFTDASTKIYLYNTSVSRCLPEIKKSQKPLRNANHKYVHGRAVQTAGF